MSMEQQSWRVPDNVRLSRITVTALTIVEGRGFAEEAVPRALSKLNQETTSVRVREAATR